MIIDHNVDISPNNRRKRELRSSGPQRVVVIPCRRFGTSKKSHFKVQVPYTFVLNLPLVLCVCERERERETERCDTSIRREEHTYGHDECLLWHYTMYRLHPALVLRPFLLLFASKPPHQYHFLISFLSFSVSRPLAGCVLLR